jgi:phenylalanyl-tRNA synthetase alpha chain
MTELSELESQLIAAVDAAGDEAALDEVRVSALGKKGTISERMKTLGKMDPEERKAAGQALNALKDKVADAIAARATALKDAALDARLASEFDDVTLPVRPELQGSVHPVSRCGKRWCRFSATWALPSLKARTSRPTGTILVR